MTIRGCRCDGGGHLCVDANQLRWALHGWQYYGKGRHRAGLNFGDCFSYGLAMALDRPLLFKGDDFSQTDVKVAVF